MSQIIVTPDNAKQVLKELEPGTEVVFKAGRYLDVLKIKLGNSLESPLTILRGEPGAIITMNLSADDFREEGNLIAKRVQDGEIPTANSYPGLYPIKMDGRLKIKKSANILIQGLTFEESWPTHVAIKKCQNLTFRDCDFRDATFAVAAMGKTTYGLRFDRCRWVQDRIAGRIWKEIPWGRIHGDYRDDPDKYDKVDVKNDWRLFDGDFIRGEDIAGGITLEHCEIGQAFNAIHFYNPKKKLDRCVDINVHDCHFFEIRDNVLEPEACAYNWWFWNNTIKNAHKPFSLNIVKGGAFYIFSNRWWFDSIQGPDSPKESRGGGMFKFHSNNKQKQLAPNYVFHNSIATRSDYARKGQFSGLQHFNNAIWVAHKGESYDRYILDEADFFGEVTYPTSEPDYLKKRFITNWGLYNIRFESDVIYDPSWPEKLLAAGYDGVNKSYAEDPRFRNVFEGDFELGTRSPCYGKSMPKKITMPIGDDFLLPGGQDIGALQGLDLTRGPEFRPVYSGSA